MGTLAHSMKSILCNFEHFKMDNDFKLDRQIAAIVRSRFFLQLAGVKSIFAQKHFETVILTFPTSQLKYCNAVYLFVSQSSLKCFKQNAVALLLTGVRNREHITPILASLH